MGAIVSGSIRGTQSLADLVGPAPGSRPTGFGADQSAFRTLLHLALTRASGLVLLIDEALDGPHGQAVAIRLEQGQVIRAGAERESVDEAVLRYAIEHRLVGQTELAQVVEHCEVEGAKVGRTLFSKKLVRAPELLKALRSVLARRIAEAASIERGRVVFAPSEAVRFGQTADVVSADLGTLLGDVVRRRLRSAWAPQLMPLLAPLSGQAVELDRSDEALLEGMHLTERERVSVDSVLTGEYTLGETLALSVASPNEMARLLVLLAVFGLLSTVDLTRDLSGSRLEALRKRLATSDHFARLGGHWTTHPDELQSLYGRLVERLEAHPNVRRMVEAAGAVVLDGPKRRAYRRTLVSQDQLLHAADLLEAQAKTAVFRNENRLAGRLSEVVAELRRPA